MAKGRKRDAFGTGRAHLEEVVVFQVNVYARCNLNRPFFCPSVARSRVSREARFPPKKAVALFVRDSNATNEVLPLRTVYFTIDRRNFQSTFLTEFPVDERAPFCREKLQSPQKPRERLAAGNRDDESNRKRTHALAPLREQFIR